MNETFTSAEANKYLRVNNAPEALQLSTLDELVGQGAVIDREFRESHPKARIKDVAVNRELTVHRMLREKDMPSSGTPQEEADFNNAVIVYKIAMSHSQEEWTDPEKGTNGLPPRNIVLQELRDYYRDREAVASEASDVDTDNERQLDDETDKKPSPSQSTVEQPAQNEDNQDQDAKSVETANDSHDDSQDSMEELNDNLTNARDVWAKQSARRSGRLRGGDNADYRYAEAAYKLALQKHGEQLLHDELSGDMTDEEKNIAVVTYLFDQQEQLREQITSNLNGTKVGRFVNFMNSGTKLQRVGKGIAVGVGAGIAGSFLAGAAGAGVIAAGTIAAAKFAKGYARHDQRGIKSADEQFDSGAVAEAMTDERSVLSDDERDDRFNDANRHFGYLLEDQTKDQQKKRRTAVAWGAGSVALGATLGWGIHQAAEYVSSRDLQLSMPFKNGIQQAIDFDFPRVDVPSDVPDFPKVGDFADKDGDNIPDSIDSDSYDNDSGKDVQTPDITVNPSEPIGRSGMFNGYMGTRAMTPEAVTLMHDQLDGYVVKPGDSVWSISEQFLHDQGIAYPTTFEIDATKDLLLAETKAAGLADTQGQLTVGSRIRL